MLQMYINLLWVNAILLLLVFLPDFWQGLEKGGVGVLQRHIIKTVDENVAMCVCVCVCDTYVTVYRCCGGVECLGGRWAA
jgi:hypothetical protein